MRFLGVAGPGPAWRGMAGQDGAWRGSARQGFYMQSAGFTRLGPASCGVTRRGVARPGLARQYPARLGRARQGSAWHGAAWRGKGVLMMETAPETGQVQEGRSPPFSISIETTLLIERIKALKAGELLSYRDLNKLIGQDVQGEARHILQSARRICQREYQVVTDAERNVGVRRATDVELTTSGIHVFARLRRAAKRGIERVTSVSDFDALPDAEKIRHNATVSALAVMRHMAKPKSVDRIMGAVNTEGTGQLPIARTLELFRGPKKV